MSTIQNEIQQLIEKALKPSHLFLVNESDKHSGPPNRESHFLLVAVSDEFAEKSRLDRQRRINEILAPIFQKGLHALTMKLHSVAEWEKLGAAEKIFASPDCGHKK